MNRFETFTLLITKISRSIRKMKSNEMSKFNLKTPHVSCLYYLNKNGKMSAKNLCDVCDEDKAAISRSIDYLEKKNLIFCESKTEKRYKSPLFLTEQGKQVADVIVEKVDRILKVTSEGIDEKERDIFYKCLAKISENLEKLCK